MPTLSAPQIASLVRTYWTLPDDKAVATVVAIALAESGGRTDAINTANRNGTRDWGLFQVNDVNWKATDSSSSRLDPDVNTRKAYEVYKGQGLKAWVTYNVGAHEKYMKQATAAALETAKGGVTPPGSEPGTTGGTGGEFIDGFKDAVSFSTPLDVLNNALADFQGTMVKIMNSVLLWLIAFLFLILGIIIVARRQGGAAVSLAGPGKITKAVTAVSKVAGS